eukprot:scaffold120488_cov20-Tisochrysis_lutea.AAC.2
MKPVAHFCICVPSLPERFWPSSIDVLGTTSYGILQNAQFNCCLSKRLFCYSRKNEHVNLQTALVMRLLIHPAHNGCAC